MVLDSRPEYASYEFEGLRVVNTYHCDYGVVWVDFPLRRAFPHVDKPESETCPSSPVEQAGYGTRVFEAVVDASGHRGLGFFSSLGLSFRFPEGDGLRGGARLLSMVAL